MHHPERMMHAGIAAATEPEPPRNVLAVVLVATAMFFAGVSAAHRPSSDRGPLISRLCS
jgi:hypothetical protein